MRKGRRDGGRLVAAMRHAVRALLLATGAVGIPVGPLHQRLDGPDAAYAEQIAAQRTAKNVGRRRRPSYALGEGYAGPFKELMQTTDWDSYGTGRYEKCGVAFAEQIAGLLPAENVARRL